MSVGVATHALEYGRHFESLNAVSQLLTAGRSVRIVTLGGSVPYGNNCIRPDGEHHRACAWPARVVHALRTAFPLASVDHNNMASGGNGVVRLLYTCALHSARMCILPCAHLLSTLACHEWESV